MSIMQFLWVHSLCPTVPEWTLISVFFSANLIVSQSFLLSDLKFSSTQMQLPEWPANLYVQDQNIENNVFYIMSSLCLHCYNIDQKLIKLKHHLYVCHVYCPLVL